MRWLPVMFEDHTVAGFRPVAWTVPTSELRCGILNPRERAAHVFGAEPVLLLRDFLAPHGRELGHRVGPEAVEAARAGVSSAGMIWLSPRLGADWAAFESIQRRLDDGDAELLLADDEGLLAATVRWESAETWFESWRTWNDQAGPSGCWRDAAVEVPRWQAPGLEHATQGAENAWRRIWDLVPATAAAIGDDLAHLGEWLPARRIWGAVPVEPEHARWLSPVALQTAAQRGLADRVVAGHADRVWLGPQTWLAPNVAIDASSGPVILSAGVRVMPHVFLEGPLYIGTGSVVKAGATIYGETSLGVVNKVAGEIGESTFLDFVNKQHDGFIGHAYLASWCNLGAMTTNSDLKNTYGTIRVDLGSGAEDTGLRFIGLLMGEHGKTAIGTLFNTGTTVGFGSNVFGSGFPAKSLPCFTWGDGRGGERHDPPRALATAATVLARRGCRATDGITAIFQQFD